MYSKIISLSFIILFCPISLSAQDLVVLECNSEETKWIGTIEIDITNKKLKYDNLFDRVSNDLWNEVQKDYANKTNKEYKPLKYEAPLFQITTISPSLIQATPGFSLRGDLEINRYTLTLKEKMGEYKCQRKQKEF